MKKRKVCLVINPREGQNVAKLADILAVLDAAGCKTSVVLKEYAGHTQKLAQQAAEDRYDLVIAYGGDGTINQVVNGVMNAGSKPMIGAIPGGTANEWVHEISLPADDPVKTVMALLESEDRLVDVGHVTVDSLLLPGDTQPTRVKRRKRGKAENLRSHFLLMAGLGLDAAVMQGVSKPLKHKVKQLAVGLSAAKELPSFRPFPLELSDEDHHLLWRGEALQVVVGNTRLYADVLHMTPNAYIDDGQLDVCILTSGTFLGTMGQIFSLLLRRQPDSNFTAEYFKGTRLFMKVPAPVAIQLDGSAVKLNDVLQRVQKQVLKNMESLEGVVVEYCFEASPRALHVAVPRTYDNTLFEKRAGHEQAEAPQQEVSPAAEEDTSSTDMPKSEDTLPVFAELLSKVRAEGRKVNVLGTSFDVEHGAYIVAGKYTQASSGAAKPTAVRADDTTTILSASGEKLAPLALRKLREGQEIIVSGKKRKRGGIQARYVVV